MEAYEKTVTINGKPIHFKHRVQTHELYQEAFHTALKADLALADSDENFFNAILKIYPQVVWALAKTADPTIPSFKAWYKQIGKIDILAVCEELVPLFE